MNYKHGFARKNKVERLHGLWRDMLKRCKNHPDYKGRGIKVCDNWLEYLNFRVWAHANGYSENLTIDRIDNEKGYSPSNCRWASKKVQARNRRSSTFIEFNGQRKTIAEWAETTGISASLLSFRFRNWPVERVFEPVRSSHGTEQS